MAARCPAPWHRYSDPRVSWPDLGLLAHRAASGHGLYPVRHGRGLPPGADKRQQHRSDGHVRWRLPGALHGASESVALQNGAGHAGANFHPAGLGMHAHSEPSCVYVRRQQLLVAHGCCQLVAVQLAGWHGATGTALGFPDSRRHTFARA
ncbi:unnamed protein product [Symbiodinium necroappetens]|uniref:Uncharacterized protein n=1 Tax=Symbiodinium necroappetens TaxID=1628268 RepID=A0A812PAP9_9DINO|nr:unnamed protein product [Symbiodinium necroappetens]